MKAYALLAVGVALIVFGLAAAVFIAKSQKRPVERSIWFRAYVILLVTSLTATGLLLTSSLFVRLISVNAYRDLFDGLSLALVGTLFSGLILVIRRPRFLVSYIIFSCGAVVTFGEFLGR